MVAPQTRGAAPGGPRPDDGASALEFALVSVVLFTLIFGLVQAGRAVWTFQAVSAASREASRFAIATKVNGATPQYRDCTGIRAAARARVPDIGLADSDIDITYKQYPTAPGPSASPTATPSCSAAALEIESGDRVVVEVTRRLDVSLPLIPWGSVDITARDERTIYLESSP